jgi:hypothetical protein
MNNLPKLVIVLPNELCRFTGIASPLEHVAVLPGKYIGIEARKKADELFLMGYEIVDRQTGNPADKITQIP